MKYGIELEYFILDKNDMLIPAYKATSNLDGNPVIGEIRTKVHDNILDCIFELEKLIFIEKNFLSKKGYKMDISNTKTVDDKFLENLRRCRDFTDKKENEILEEFSVYPKGKTGKILSKNILKASLQVNISKNGNFSYPEYTKVTVDDKYKYDCKTIYKQHSDIFNYPSYIFKLDEAFSKEIDEAKRVKGVYSIKSGEIGTRIEYRSLPNNINLQKLLYILDDNLNKNPDDYNGDNY